VLLALDTSSSSSQRSLLQQELNAASMAAAAAEQLAASGSGGFHAVLPGSDAQGGQQLPRQQHAASTPLLLSCRQQV
jgi:hypothetical protein